jgi:cation diffusion facilitator family transporter
MLRLAAAPPSEQHHYGLSKVEYFSAGIEGGLIAIAAGAIAVAAVPRLIEPRPLDVPALGLALTAIATGLNLAVALILRRAGRDHHSITLQADAQHLLTDVWTSVGVIAGVGLVAATGWLRLDPLIALGVATHILWAGAKLMRRSVAGLLDVAIPEADRAGIGSLMQQYSKRHGVAFHALRTREAGARRYVSFHLLVPDAWSVSQAHQLSEEIEERIRSLVPNCSVITHIEPISHPSSYDDMDLDR